ncbi:hypothetical protein [Paraflavitalea sp. CAU 1676]|uniref:hypothetical protein n=1 Tax=Paraflavitalea sp. CAU 1676 TaxID=3032598 RepID=UPI0023DAB49F|nr:hypothetical protein [Paraflavitalea sp. CAU 1676]MDF2193785.1 hypothetical protein [Paraflavitalea sp. CAU 1676]
MKTETSTYHFPFIGAGNADYYEWASITIRLKQEPTKQQQQQIAKSRPGVWKTDDDIFHGRIISVISDQFVNMWIQESYGNDDEEMEDDADDFFEDNPEFYASKASKAAFEKDIERWLHEIHAICPIEFAFRNEDGEAGGTELSPWHEHSITLTKELIATWSADPQLAHQGKEEAEYFREAVGGILHYAGISEGEISEPLASYLHPDGEIKQLLEAADPNAIGDYLRKIKSMDHDAASHDAIQEAIDEHCIQLCVEREYATIYKLHFLYRKKTLLENPIIGPFIYAAWLNNDKQLIKETLQQIGHPCEMNNNIGHFIVSDLFPEQKWVDTIQLFTLALDNEAPASCEYLELYCNALYVCQNDNTGLPIDKALNERFLNKCLPFAPANPAIYFNAACLYVEMKDFEKTLECIQLAKKHTFDGYEGMMEAIATGSIFAEFLGYPPFKKWNK